MKRPFLAILSLAAITVGLAGCGGDKSEIPAGYSEADIKAPTDQKPAPDPGDAKVDKGD